MVEEQFMRQFLVAVIVLIMVTGCTGSKDDSQPVDIVDVISDVEVQEACPDDLVWWPDYDLCAPQVDDCNNPWELPLVAGGCVAIGPRACPKLWNPAADVNCEPGELMDYDGMACQEGFVLTEDELACIPFFEENCGEMEINVLGGGCKKVGPEWGVEGEPYFDECPEGHLALMGGDCVQVGPRACPKLWDPESDLDCEVGEPQPCPEGWNKSEDGMYCDPLYAECSFGERALVGGTCQRLIPGPEDCPAGPYPDVPEQADNVVHVLAKSSCTDNCGSESSPYPSIQEAIDAVPDGGHVLIGAGIYDEGLLIAKPVHVAGLCAAVVTVAGVAQIPDGDSKIPSAGIAVIDTEGVSVSGMKITSPTVGIVLEGAVGVDLLQLELTAVAGVGLFAGKNSIVSASEIWIHDTLPSEEIIWMKGQGIWVQDGGNATIDAGLVETTYGAGFLVQHEASHLAIEGSIARHVQPVKGSLIGYGYSITDGAYASISASLAELNQGIGISATDNGSQVDISATVVRTTMASDSGQGGAGLVADDGSTVTMSGSLIQENTAIALAIYDTGTTLKIDNSVIRKTLASPGGLLGRGIQSSGGCALTISGSLLEQNRTAGVAVFDSGTSVSLAGSLIRNTFSAGDGQSGGGVYAHSGSTVSLAHSLVENNRDTGLAAFNPDTEISVMECVIRKTIPDNNGDNGFGIWADSGCDMSVKDSLIVDSQQIGVIVDQADTVIEFSGSVISGTRSSDSGKNGYGLQAGEGCTVVLSTTLVEENSRAGVIADHPSTTMTIVDSIIRNTLPNGKGIGPGLEVRGGSEVTTLDSLIDNNSTLNITVFDPETVFTISGSTIRNALAGEGGGHGVQVGLGATTTVHRCLLEGNPNVALYAMHPGTKVDIVSSTIRNTLPDTDGNNGMGVVVFEGAGVALTDSLLDSNRDVALNLSGSDTEIFVDSCVVRNTLADGNGYYGRGLNAQNGSKVAIFSSLFEANHDAGIAALQMGTEITVSGSIIRQTKPLDKGTHGEGFIVGLGAYGDISLSLIKDNFTGGIFVDSQFQNQKTHLDIDSCVISDTGTKGAAGHGDMQVFGDGIVAYFECSLNVQSSIVRGNDRVGLYYSKSSGTVFNTVIEGNGSYGLAMNECESKVAYSDIDAVSSQPDNFLFGNALELPAEIAMQISPNPGNLPVPNQPEVAAIPAAVTFDESE
jgi:hypothetical protein